MRVIVTGGRDLFDRELVSKTMDWVRGVFGPLTLVHGGANGADQLAHEWAESIGLSIERHPAMWDLHGRAAGPIRNAYMVELGAQLLVRFPGGAGTANCAMLADRAGIPVLAASRKDGRVFIGPAPQLLISGRAP